MLVDRVALGQILTEYFNCFPRHHYCTNAPYSSMYIISVHTRVINSSISLNKTLKKTENWQLMLKLIHTYHAVPLPRPCCSSAMLFPCLTLSLPCRAAKGSDCVFPIWFTQCGRFWFTHAMPRPCRFESDFSGLRHSSAWARHGMCELASAVQRRHVGDLPAFGFFQLPRGVQRRLLSEAYKFVKL
jgi:hypothetical protein